MGYAKTNVSFHNFNTFGHFGGNERSIGSIPIGSLYIPILNNRWRLLIN